MAFKGNMQATVQPGLMELYEFTRGNEIQRYTTWQEEITFGGQVYKSAVIKRSPLSLDQSFKAIKVDIELPLRDPVVDYIANTPVEPVLVRIYQVFEVDLSDYQVIFAGAIKSITLKDKFGKLVCESVSKVFKLKLPNVIYQAFCNHRLFDLGCTLNDAVWKVETAVTISGSDLVSNDFAAYPNGYFTGGHVAFDTDMRLITNHVGDTITLQIPFDTRVQSGTIIKGYPGCDKNPATCLNKFNNMDNFLGMPYIPSSNPVIWGFR